MIPITTIDIKPNTRVLVRIDVNEPIDEIGIPQDTFRLRASLPTIQYLIEKQARIILVAHLGNPEGKEVLGLKLDYIAEELGILGGFRVKRAPSLVGNNTEELIESCHPGEVLMLPNLRFDPREEQNSDSLALELSRFAELYVNEAFSVSHRAHTSVSAITKYLPSYAGIRLMQEVETLNEILDTPKHPAVAIVGGAKIETKLPVIEVFQKIFDTVLVGGKIANEYLDQFGSAKDTNIILPVDFAEGYKDIGPRTIERFRPYLESASTIVWNGPMGMIEVFPFDRGTRDLIKIITHRSKAYTVIGGGETVDMIHQMKIEDKIDFISTGGGAMLEFITKRRDMPGLRALG